MNFDKPRDSAAIAALQRLRAARTKDSSSLPAISHQNQTEELLKEIKSSINLLLQGVEALCQWEKRKDEQFLQQSQHIEDIASSLAAISKYFTEQEELLQEDITTEELPQESVAKIPTKTFLVPIPENQATRSTITEEKNLQLSLQNLTQEV